MSSPAVQPNLVLIRRLADGKVEWIPLGSAPSHVPVAADAAYTVVDRAHYEAPQTLLVHRQGDDLVVEVEGTDALVLDGFFTAAHVAFYPTTNIASGAGPFTGSPLTADSSVPAASPAGEQEVWSATPEDEHAGAAIPAVGTSSAAAAGGGSSPMLWAGLAAGGLGLAALAGGGGGSGGGETSTPPPPDTVAPTFTSGATAPAIAENSGAGQVVYTATATDTNALTYSLKADGDAAAFRINAKSGTVTLTGNPDFEAKSSYSFTVIATDAANNSTEQPVSLAIANVNDTPVNITSGATAAIAENVGAGQPAYTVTATTNTATALTYSLKAVGDAVAFTINASSGVVTLAANPDFEAKSSYNFTVVATDAANNSAEQAVVLAINNLDEVAPTITSGATATAINENSGPSQVVYTATSTDTGDISTGSTSYSLKPGGDATAFSINATTGAVTLTGNPDFEAKSSYAFTVIATDAANNRAEQPVSLAITNVNDTPVTITSGATAAIAENIGAGRAAYTVTATATTGTAVTYSLKAVGDAAAFTINASSGVVRLTANPNFEAKSSYNFTVVATDAANNSGEQAVVLAINNLDEVAPTITSGAVAPTINENSGAGQVVYTVTSTDTGDISTGATTYSLKPGSDSAAFTINANTGAVTLTGNPNSEAKSSYAFTVVARDAAGHSSERAVTLAINDLDDSPPTITSSSTAHAINENSGPGQVVYTVTSTDTGDNIVTGPTTYSLKPVADSAAFSINATTGAVTLTANPDDETKGSYNFTVVATDGAGNSSERAVSLEINDLDEVAPTITSSATAAAITENSGSGQVVYTVTSTDTGDISIGATTYSLKAGSDSAAFTINPNTGAVTLVGNPDFEAKQSYNFTVVATDSAHLSSERAVSLAVTDVVDETPPNVSGVAITGAAGAQDGILNAGDTVNVTVTMTENTLVNTSGGTPTIGLSVGGDTVNASYVSGSGTSSLVFAYTIQPGDDDANGISIPPNSLARNGGSIADLAGNAANLGHGAVADNASFVVDTTAPTLSSSTPDDNDHDIPHDANIVLTFDDAMQIGSGNVVITGPDSRTIDVTDGSQVSINGNQVTINPTLDLIPGANYSVQIDSTAFTDDGGNPYAGISNHSTLNFRIADLFPGPSGLAPTQSSESSRVFQSPMNEQFDIRVASNETSDSAVTWSGTTNFGSDERVALVGIGTEQSSVNPSSIAEAAWADSNAASVHGADSPAHFEVSLSDAHDAGGQPNIPLHVDVPIVILTSQGLA